VLAVGNISAPQLVQRVPAFDAPPPSPIDSCFITGPQKQLKNVENGFFVPTSL